MTICKRLGASPLHSGNPGYSSYLEGMARESFTRRDTASIARGKSVMFSVHFDDGRTGYFVVKGHGSADEDHQALSIAQERQRTGEVPEGVILKVKRVR